MHKNVPIYTYNENMAGPGEEQQFVRRKNSKMNNCIAEITTQINK